MLCDRLPFTWDSIFFNFSSFKIRCRCSLCSSSLASVTDRTVIDSKSIWNTKHDDRVILWGRGGYTMARRSRAPFCTCSNIWTRTRTRLWILYRTRRSTLSDIWWRTVPVPRRTFLAVARYAPRPCSPSVWAESRNRRSSAFWTVRISYNQHHYDCERKKVVCTYTGYFFNVKINIYNNNIVRRVHT